jgi:phosphate transport system substrate-binding protein
MQAMLEELNALPGVVGSMRCDADGRPVAQALPPGQPDANLREAAAAAADSLRALREATGEATHLDLRYTDRRIVIVPAIGGSVVLVCDKAVDPRLLLPRVAEVLRRAGEIPGQGVPPAAPPSPQPPARAARTGAPRPPAAAPRGGPAWRSPPVLAGALALLALVAGIAWWAVSRNGAASGPAPAADPVTLLRIGGAKSFAAELAPALARAYLESLEVRDVQVARLEAHRFTVRGVKDGAPWAIAVEGMNTPDGFGELAAGRLDVAMAGRRIRPEWQQKLDAFGPMMTPGREHVVALSGIAVVVNPSNPVAQLDRRRLADVFSGAVTDWAQLAGKRTGEASPVVVYAGDEQMGLPELFRTLVLGKTPYTPQARRLPTLQEITDAVAQDPRGIGFVTLPFVRGTRAVPISEGDEPPLVPTAFTLATEDYFLSHRLYFYTLPRPDNSHLARFVQFALGPEGQSVVKKSGYVELSVATAPRDPPPDAPPGYARLTRGAIRLSSTFRFEPASADFDTRALVDLERVTAYLIENRLNGPSVRVFGFTDAQGAPAVNRALSLARAEQVARALAQRGIAGVAVEGFGSALPVASNQTPEGRERNRRVEVWVAR